MDSSVQVGFGDRFQLRFCISCVAFMALGAAIGTLLARYYTAFGAFSAKQLLSAVLQRQPLRAILISVLFSLLVCLCSLLSFRVIAIPVLFFVKGLCLSYFTFLLTVTGKTAGFLVALCILLFHSILLLPVQLYGACALAHRDEPKYRTAAPERMLLLLSVAALLACLSELFLTPYICSLLLTQF